LREPNPTAATLQVMDLIEPMIARGMGKPDALLCVLLDRTKDRAVRVDAGKMLLDSGHVAGLTTLFEQFRNEADYAECWEFACVIGALHTPESTQRLVEVLRDSADSNKRSASAYALGLSGDRSAIPALLDAFRNAAEDPGERGQAAEALARLDAVETLPVLLKGLHDPSVEVRFWSAAAVGSLGRPEVIPELESLLSDEEAPPGWHSVAEEASNAIRSIRDRHSETDAR
jgi:HEAT repeat protein